MNGPYGKPEAVLHERAGNLDVFKLYNGHRFLITTHDGQSLNLPDWEARALYEWLGANLPPQRIPTPQAVNTATMDQAQSTQAPLLDALHKAAEDIKRAESVYGQYVASMEGGKT